MFVYVVFAVEIYRNTISDTDLTEFPYNVTTADPRRVTNSTDVDWPTYWSECSTFHGNPRFADNNFDNIFRGFK